jgi:hypothetical protein
MIFIQEAADLDIGPEVNYSDTRRFIMSLEADAIFLIDLYLFTFII